MNYEKKYKEALERARKINNGKEVAAPEGWTVCEVIFPELKESEDEKIRKWLIGYFRQYKEDGIEKYANGLKVESIIAWLEKQGEKPIDKVEPRFKAGDWVVDSQRLTHQIERVVENVTTHTFGYDIVGGGYFNDDNEGVHLWTIQDAKDGDVLALNGEVFIYAHRKRLYSIAVTHCFVDSVSDFYVDGEFGYTEKGNSIHPATKEQRELLFQKMREAGYEWDAEKKELRKIERKITESESESIRKSLLKHFGKSGTQFWFDRNIKYRDVIAWLEKQGNTINKDDCVQAVLRGAAINLITWIDYKVAEGNMCLSNTECKDIVDALASCNWDKIYDYMKKKLEKQALKPKWSEEDERIYQSIIDDTVQENQLDSKQIDWLKSIKQRME